MINLRSKTIMFILSLIFGAILFSCGGDDDGSTYSNGNGSPGENEIWMQNISFMPDAKTISTGTTITWINKDASSHTVTSGAPGSPTGLFDSGSIGQDEQFSYTFNSAGTFNFYCSFHPDQMQGTITVQ